MANDEPAPGLTPEEIAERHRLAAALMRPGSLANLPPNFLAQRDQQIMARLLLDPRPMASTADLNAPDVPMPARMQAGQAAPAHDADLSAQAASEAAARRISRGVRHGAGRSGVELLEAVSPTAADVVRSAGTGVAQGAIGVVGLPGDLRHMAGMATDFAGRKLGVSADEVDAFKQRMAVPGLASLPTSDEIQKTIEGYTGKFHQPKTIAGEYARSFGEMAPAALFGPGRLAQKVLMGAAAPAVVGETAGQFSKGTEAEPWWRMGGALLGGALGMRGPTPFPATPEHAARTAVVEGAGTRLSAGERSGSQVVQALEGIGAGIPFDKYGPRRAGALNERSRQDVASSMERLQRESGDVRDLHAMRNAAAKAEAQGAEGLPTAKQVRQAIVAQGRDPSAPGQGKFAEFVDAADAVIRPIPEKWGRNEGFLAGAVAFPVHQLSEPFVGPNVATPLAAAVPAIAGRAALSPLGQMYLGNQAMPVSRQELIRALLAQGVVARPKDIGE
jgi:hypothetical protein